jgi:hypothetical protein
MNFMDKCPYKIGDKVRFKPSQHSTGWTPHRETWGLVDDEAYKILDIQNGVYLYVSENQSNGWHWKDFEIVD